MSGPHGSSLFNEGIAIASTLKNTPNLEENLNSQPSLCGKMEVKGTFFGLNYY